MSNRFAACARSGDGRSDLADIVSDNVWTGTDTRHVLDASWRVPVEILTADGNTGDEICERRTVLAKGRLESGYLIIDGRLSSRTPETQQEGGLRIDGCLDGFCGGIGGAGLNQSVDTGTGEAGCTDEILCGGEVILVLLLRHGRIVGVGTSIVETLHESVSLLLTVDRGIRQRDPYLVRLSIRYTERASQGNERRGEHGEQANVTGSSNDNLGKSYKKKKRDGDGDN